MQIPTKSRVDIIDTAFQRQKELKALKILSLVFLVTVFYQFQEEFWHLLPQEQIQTAELGREGMRRIPIKRVQRIISKLEKLQIDQPLMRFPLRQSLGDLKALHLTLVQKKEQGNDKLALLQILDRIQMILDQNIWKSQEQFTPVIGDMTALRKVLRLPSPRAPGVPHLQIGPRAPEPMAPPIRNLFAYVEH